MAGERNCCCSLITLAAFSANDGACSMPNTLWIIMCCHLAPDNYWPRMHPVPLSPCQQLTLVKHCLQPIVLHRQQICESTRLTQHTVTVKRCCVCWSMQHATTQAPSSPHTHFLQGMYKK